MASDEHHGFRYKSDALRISWSLAGSSRGEPKQTDSISGAVLPSRGAKRGGAAGDSQRRERAASLKAAGDLMTRGHPELRSERAQWEQCPWRPRKMTALCCWETRPSGPQEVLEETQVP